MARLSIENLFFIPVRSLQWIEICYPFPIGVWMKKSEAKQIYPYFSDWSGHICNYKPFSICHMMFFAFILSISKLQNILDQITHAHKTTNQIWIHEVCPPSVASFSENLSICFQLFYFLQLNKFWIFWKELKIFQNFHFNSILNVMKLQVGEITRHYNRMKKKTSFPNKNAHESWLSQFNLTWGTSIWWLFSRRRKKKRIKLLVDKTAI